MVKVICSSASGTEYEIQEDKSILRNGKPFLFDSKIPIKYFGIADGKAMKQEWADYYQKPPYRNAQGATVEGMCLAFYHMKNKFVREVSLENIADEFQKSKDSLVGIIEVGNFHRENTYLVITSPLEKVRKED